MPSFSDIVPANLKDGVANLKNGVAGMRDMRCGSYEVFDDDETGTWHYLALQDYLISDNPHWTLCRAGTLIKVNKRKQSGRKGTYTLWLSDGGYLKDVGLDGGVLDLDTHALEGKWIYRVVFPTGVAIRGKLSLEKPRDTIVLPCNSEIGVDLTIEVPKKYFVSKVSKLGLNTSKKEKNQQHLVDEDYASIIWLRLVDQSGWVYMKKKNAVINGGMIVQQAHHMPMANGMQNPNVMQPSMQGPDMVMNPSMQGGMSNISIFNPVCELVDEITAPRRITELNTNFVQFRGLYGAA